MASGVSRTGQRFHSWTCSKYSSSGMFLTGVTKRTPSVCRSISRRRARDSENKPCVESEARSRLRSSSSTLLSWAEAPHQLVARIKVANRFIVSRCG